MPLSRPMPGIGRGVHELHHELGLANIVEAVFAVRDR